MQPTTCAPVDPWGSHAEELSVKLWGNWDLQHFFSFILSSVFLASAELAGPLSMWELDMLESLSKLIWNTAVWFNGPKTSSWIVQTRPCALCRNTWLCIPGNVHGRCSLRREGCGPTLLPRRSAQLNAPLITALQFQSCNFTLSTETKSSLYANASNTAAFSFFLFFFFYLFEEEKSSSSKKNKKQKTHPPPGTGASQPAGAWLSRPSLT